MFEMERSRAGPGFRTLRHLKCPNVRPDTSFSSPATLVSGLTFGHLKSQMSEYQTLPQPVVASGLLTTPLV
jgi:hypothetical protein